MVASWIGKRVTVVIESPAGSVVKRDPRGAVDMVSPMPLPFHYGSVPGEQGGDGDPLDAIVWGGRHASGDTVDVPVWAVVHFVDAGRVDDKLVCGEASATRWWAVRAFFSVYTPIKRAVAWWRGLEGRTYVAAVSRHDTRSEAERTL